MKNFNQKKVKVDTTQVPERRRKDGAEARNS
jgi:hypothetical protein